MVKINRVVSIFALKKKYMKKLTTIFVLFLASTLSYGQGLNIKAGLNLSSIATKVGGEKSDEDVEFKKLLPGINAGITYVIDIKKGLYIEPGLLYSLKGYKYSNKEGGDYVKNLARVHYIEIPVNFGYKYNFDKKDMGIFAYLGPYFGMAIGGKYVGKYKIDGEKDKESEKVEFGKDATSRIDAGLNIGVGFEVKKISFGIQYGIGLANLVGKDVRGSGDYKIKQNNRVLGINIGYRFGDKKEE
jgi:hypothetical protein